jgi:hypothetical protein
MWMATGFSTVCAGAVLHAQGGEMQTFFPCSNPACQEEFETLKHVALPASSARGAAVRGGNWRESAEEDDACL